MFTFFVECGRSYMRDSKIVGGENANFGEQPWQVMLKIIIILTKLLWNFFFNLNVSKMI